MLFLRFALAGALMAAIMFARGSHWPQGRNLWLLVAMGAVGGPAFLPPSFLPSPWPFFFFPLVWLFVFFLGGLG
ncbi:MAG: hypothetical protein IPJ48_18780 [Propionivibrio sp.]|uniref:Uncharacterized protein n=1 Tax=Candidatus Propionivibrio dominans TaxID=2954373 RepID=A0A9D7IHY1_9RHOO|nr:hypothetical protein [Candidatus Propionivibrio dominans]